MDTLSMLVKPPGAGDLMIKAVSRSDTEPLGVAYGLSPEQAAFFKGETRIDNDDELKTHILEVQERAYKVFPYACIRSFTYLQPGIATLPEYDSIIRLGQERSDGIFLDIGCCFGVDARRAAADGYPLENILTTDLRKEFYELGHSLFRTTSETYPISFVAADALDPNMLQVVTPFDEPPLTERPDLSTLTSLNPLAGHCAVIYASNFFHLFSEENQFKLAKALAGLLSPLPGSMICGEHAGNLNRGIYHAELSGSAIDMFQHSPESWKTVWDGYVFSMGKVRVDAQVEKVDKGAGLEYYRLQWSVVRL